MLEAVWEVPVGILKLKGRQSHGRSARFWQGQAASTVENSNPRLAKLERDLRDLDEKVDGWEGAGMGWGGGGV